MAHDIRLEKLTRAGIALMQEEKEAALRGDMTALAEINERKADFLAQMEEISRLIESTGPMRTREVRKQEIATLFGIMRRRAEENQYLLRAASNGVKSAIRQIAALADPADLGAYASDGEPLRSGEAGVTTGGIY
ncbi:MAG: hypothetical protein KTR21_14330 [Rhodobacteraceae bacterium]|nr:hypothetical protein [Paracoccaceae bacterium]